MKDQIEVYDKEGNDRNGRDLYRVGPFLAYPSEEAGKFVLSEESLFMLWDIGEELMAYYNTNKQYMDIRVINGGFEFNEGIINLAQQVYDLFGGNKLLDLKETEDKGNCGILNIDEHYFVEIAGGKNLDRIHKLKPNVTEVRKGIYMIRAEGIISARRNLHGLAEKVLRLHNSIQENSSFKLGLTKHIGAMGGS